MSPLIALGSTLEPVQQWRPAASVRYPESPPRASRRGIFLFRDVGIHCLYNSTESLIGALDMSTLERVPHHLRYNIATYDSQQYDLLRIVIDLSPTCEWFRMFPLPCHTFECPPHFHLTSPHNLPVGGSKPNDLAECLISLINLAQHQLSTIFGDEFQVLAGVPLQLAGDVLRHDTILLLEVFDLIIWNYPVNLMPHIRDETN
jgi:hypothetical protein